MKYDGKAWYLNNRNTKGEWSDLNGVMFHHTGSDNQTSMPKTLWYGYAGLPGPLCHGGIAADGTLLLTGWGRANHAGLGDDDVLRHVINEDYTGNLKPNEANTDGNKHFYGFEIMYSGSHEMTEAQYKTSVRLSALICTYHKWSEKSVIGHGEWQPGKWDPGYKKGTIMSMSKVRGHIQQAIKEGPIKATSPKPAPAPIYVPKTYDLNVGDVIRIGDSTLKVTGEK